MAIIEVAAGVDIHTATVIDLVGRVLGSERFPADAPGYAAPLAWIRSFGRLVRVGAEGTGTYGAGPARLPREEDVELVEVDRHPARAAAMASLLTVLPRRLMGRKPDPVRLGAP